MDGALNLGEVFGKVMELQQRLAETQQALGNRTVTVETGGGIVRVTANGLQRIVRIEVDPEAFRSEDQDMLEDLIVAGVNKALEEAARMAREEMQKAAGTLLPPGLDIDLSAWDCNAMSFTSPSVEALVEQLMRLPTVGRKTAQRLAATF